MLNSEILENNGGLDPICYCSACVANKLHYIFRVYINIHEFVVLCVLQIQLNTGQFLHVTCRIFENINKMTLNDLVGRRNGRIA